MAYRLALIENESHDRTSDATSVKEQHQDRGYGKGTQHQAESGDDPGRVAGLAAPRRSSPDEAELERVRAERVKYATQSEARRRAQAKANALSLRLEQAQREADAAKRSAEQAWSLVAGLRRAFYLRRMSARRRLIRRLLPKPLRRWWDERNLSRLEAVIRSSGLFDADWYSSTYPEAARSDLSPIRDYLQFGAAEGRRPRPDFDPDRYLADRPVLAFLGLDPFVHFVAEHSAGRPEGLACDECARMEPSNDARTAAGQEPAFDAREAEGCFNDGWYGSRRLSNEERFARCGITEKDRAASDARLRIATDRMVRNHLLAQPGHTVEILRKAAPTAAIQDAFLRAVPDEALRPSGALPGYAIVTPLISADEHFRMCAASVKALIEADFEATGVNRITWIIVTKPGLELQPELGSLLATLPTVFLESEARDPVAIGARHAVSSTDAEWIFALAQSAEIDPSAVSMLDYYSAGFPKCRCILASPVDVDENGIVLRWNRNVVPGSLFEYGPHQGQFTAVRRDLVAQQGNMLDYEALLKLSLCEPILAVPEYLHQQRKGFVGAGRIVETETWETEHALQGFLRRFAENFSGQETRPVPRPSALTSGLCIIRTQGKRLDLLGEAVSSVLEQTVAITPCVVVHGAFDAERRVTEWLASRHLEAAVIGAPDLERRRGYPLNVGLDFLRARRGDFDFVFFLDDDDIVYPLYGERLTALLNSTGGDIGVCLANSRVPWEVARPGHQPLPVSSLVAGNFIPIHCYVMRTELLVSNAISFDERVDYLEDWDFLVSLLATNARFAFLPEVLCEYRIIGDGNQQNKRDQVHFEECQRMVLERGRATADHLGLRRFIVDLAEFDFHERPPLSQAEIDRLIEVRGIFEAPMKECES